MAKKLTKRKAFNFLRSYFDVLNEIPEDADKLSFLISIINKQFVNEDPKELSFISNLCYESQRHSVEKSVKGWLTANKTDLLGDPTPLPMGDPTPPIPLPPKEVQVEEKGKEQEKGKVEEEINKAFSFRKSMCALGLEKSLVDDFLKNRKLKRLANTETAFNNLVIEFNKNEIPMKELMTKIVSSGWGSFKNSWLEEKKEKNVAPKKENAGIALQRQMGLIK